MSMSHRARGCVLVLALAACAVLLAPAAAGAASKPRVKSGYVSWFPVDDSHNGAQIDLTVVGATAVTLRLQTATYKRTDACTPSRWRPTAPTKPLRLTKIGASTWRYSTTNDRAVFKVLSAETQIFRISASNSSGTTQTTFTKGLCTG
jgi:hypothetical protein